MPDHRGQTYDPDEPPQRGVIGWTNATFAVRIVALVVFMAGSALAGAAFYKPTNPQPALLAVAALGYGGIAAWFALMAGNLITHPRFGEHAQFWTSRQSYNRRTIPLMLQLGILLAVGGLLFAHVQAYRHTGSGLNAVTADVLLAIIIYPFVRHRIERGRWPD